MGKGQRIRDWRKQFEIYRASGKSVSAWSKEHNIPKTTVYSWKQRKASEKRVQREEKFVELQDELPTSSLILEYAGYKIHLKGDFDAALLKKCLMVLRGVGC
jgi:hypothetical protein